MNNKVIYFWMSSAMITWAVAWTNAKIVGEYFIHELKKKEIQYLQKSIILINDKRVQKLLDFIFMIQKPVADVFIINTNESIDNYQKNFHEISSNNLNNDTIYISP